MDIEIKDVGQLRKSLKVVVTTKEIAEKYEEKYQYIRENVPVKGFRPGHIPTSVMDRKFGEAIEHEIKTSLLQEVLASIEDKNNLKIMGEPQFKEEKNFNRNSDWSFEFVVDLQPQFEMPNYKGLELKKTEVKISDEELNTRIDMIRRSKGSLVVVSEATQEDDYIVGNVVITTGETKLWEKENSNLTVKDTEVFGIPVSKDKLIGRKVGETIEFTTTIPAEYEAAEHRGKEAKFTCKISEVKRMKLAELDDAFAKEFGCENIDGFKNSLREQMTIEKQMHSEIQMEDELLDNLLKNLTVSLPEEFIKDRVAQAKEDFEHHQKEHDKKDDKQIEEDWKKEETKVLEQWRERIREYFLIGRIADLEKVEVTEADMEAHFRQVAYQVHRWPNEIRSQYEKMGMMDEVRYDIKKRKVLILLRENAKFIS